MFVWAKDSLAQSTITLWSEDFTGNLSVPTSGKNASYSWDGDVNVEYPSDVGSLSPSLSIKKDSYFEAKIFLYGASGTFTLTLKANNIDNLDVADVTSGKEKNLDGSSGKYTIDVPSGREYISIRFMASNNVRIDDLLLTAHLDCRPEKPSPSISFDKDSFSAILGEDFESPTLSNPNNLQVSYWSSDKSVATVDADGKITLRSLGSATISAIFTGNDVYQYGEASYVLNVGRRVPEGEVFYEDFSKCLSKGGNDGTTNNPSGYVVYDNIYSSGEYVFMAYKCAYLEELEKAHSSSYYIGPIKELGNTDGYLSFLVMGQDKKTSGVSVSISEGSLGGGESQHSGNERSQQTSFATEYGKWTLVNVPFKDATANTKFTITGNNVFIDSVSIVAAAKNVQVNVSSVGYASMYYERYALKVPSDMKAFTMHVEDNKLMESHRYVQGDVIPKATAVILKAPKGSYTFMVTDEKGFVDVQNQLRGSDYSTETTGGSVYYMLSRSNGEAGFYWGEDNGAAFMNGAHKAYLALQAETAAKIKSGFSFHFDDEVTGIADKHFENTNETNCYNITGQRVGNDFRNGIVIINGRKFIRK